MTNRRVVDGLVPHSFASFVNEKNLGMFHFYQKISEGLLDVPKKWAIGHLKENFERKYLFNFQILAHICLETWLFFVPSWAPGCTSGTGNQGFFHGLIPAESWTFSTEKPLGSQAFPNPLDEDEASLRIKHDPMDPRSFVSRLGRLPGSRLSSSKLTSLNLICER